MRFRTALALVLFAMPALNACAGTPASGSAADRALAHGYLATRPAVACWAGPRSSSTPERMSPIVSGDRARAARWCRDVPGALPTTHRAHDRPYRRALAGAGARRRDRPIPLAL